MTIDLQSGATDKWVADKLGIRHPLHDPPTPRLVKIWFEGKTDRIVFENELGITIDSEVIVRRGNGETATCKIPAHQ